MKQILFFQFVLIYFFCSAQIPNGSFENWTNGKPEGWLCRSNGIDPIPYEFPVSPAVDGSVAVKVIVRAITITTQTGSTPTCLVGFLKLQDTPINFAPICLSGYYKLFAADASDSLSVKATIKSNGTTIGVAEFTATTSNSAFQSFCAMVNYTSSSAPTSYEILAALNATRPLNAVNSYFILDDLRFTFLNSITENDAETRISIIPNPILEVARVSVALTDSGFDTFRVTNALGQVVKELQVNNSSVEIPLGELPAGIYFLSVLSAKKVLMTKKIVKL